MSLHNVYDECRCGLHLVFSTGLLPGKISVRIQQLVRALYQGVQSLIQPKVKICDSQHGRGKTVVSVEIMSLPNWP